MQARAAEHEGAAPEAADVDPAEAANVDPAEAADVDPAEAALELPAMLLEQEAFLMIQLLRAMRRAAERSPDGPRLPQYMVLACLEEFGPASQREIAARLRLDPSDLVAIVDRLEDEGLARRERDAADRRRYALELTDAGSEWLVKMQAFVQARRAANYPTLDPDERDQLRSLLRRALAAVDPRVTPT